MGNRNLLNAIKWFCARRDVMDFVNYFSAVVPHSTTIADAHRYSLEYDESFFVLEGFAIDLLWTNSAFAVFACMPVQLLLSELWRLHRQ